MRGKTPEDHRVHRADSCAGEHRNCEFGRHPHVNGDPVAALDSKALQHIGKLLHLHMQLAVGDPTNLAWLALP